MRAAADEPEIVEALQAMLRTAVQHLAKVVREIESGSVRNAFGLPVGGRNQVFRADAGADVRDAEDGFQLLQGAFAKFSLGRFPVNFAVTGLVVGRWHQHVERGMSSRRKCWVKPRRIAHVRRRIL